MSLIDKQMRAAKLQKETRIKINELAFWEPSFVDEIKYTVVPNPVEIADK